MLFYAQLKQMDGKQNDKWEIMVRKWTKDMSISDEKMDNSRAQHHPQTELVACPYATQYLYSIHSLVSFHFTIQGELRLQPVEGYENFYRIRSYTQDEYGRVAVAKKMGKILTELQLSGAKKMTDIYQVATA